MKHALVTGVSRGIGTAITDELLVQNWRVTGTSRSGRFPDHFLANPAFAGLKVDFGEISMIIDAIKPLFSSQPPDVLVNNVGMFQAADFAIGDEQWMSVWAQTMQVNLVSSGLLCKWFINAHSQAGSSGIIINIASRAAYRGDMQEFAAYAASKGGMVALTKSIARGFGRQGIYAYSIAPGFVDTDMARDSVEIYGEPYLTRDSCFDKMTQPHEIGNLVAFLASGQVAHMTGSTFHINGGSYML